MTDESQPVQSGPFPRRFTFKIRLEGETAFYPITAFGRSEDEAKAQALERINARLDGKIAEWK